MKLLIVGSDYHWSIERHYLKYIKKINPDTILFGAQNILLNYLKKSVINKVNHRLGFSSIYKLINIELWNLIEEFNPDCIWIFKGMQVLPHTLQNAKKKGIFLVNYNPDNPFIFTGRGSGNDFVKESLNLYDMHFTYNLIVKKQLIELYHKPVEFLPFGFEVCDSELDIIKKEKEVIKICFLGNPDKNRATYIKYLNDSGISLDIYGNGWDKFVSSKKNNLFDAVYGLDFNKVLRRYRIQLNIMRVHNLESHNMRSFEIPAVGGIQLAPDTVEHKMFFQEDKEIFLYKDLTSCTEKIKYLLNLSINDALTIRKAALKRSQDSNYSYKDLARFAFEQINYNNVL